MSNGNSRSLSSFDQDIPFPNILGVTFKKNPSYKTICIGDNGTVWDRYELYSRSDRLLDKYYQVSFHERYGVLYTKINLEGVLIAVGALVLETFVGNRPTEKHIVGYLNDNKLDNNLSNLKWITRSESYQHKKNVIGFSDIGFPEIHGLKFTFIVGTENLYCVSDNGRVFSRKKPSGKIVDYWIEKELDIRKVGSSDKEYQWVALSINGKHIRESVHVLMLMSFIGPRPTPRHVGRHLDDNSLNNLLSNLAWGTHRENAFDKVRNGKGAGELNGSSKLTQELADLIRKLKSEGMSGPQVSDEIFKISGIRVGKTVISKICNNLSWTDRTKLGNVLKPFLAMFPNYEEALVEFTKEAKDHFWES